MPDTPNKPLQDALNAAKSEINNRVQYEDLDGETIAHSEGKVSVVKTLGKLIACGKTFDGHEDVALPAVPVKPDPSKPGEYFTFMFPVGFIWISSVNTNPAVYLGYGTWAAFGQGRVLVSVNPSDTDFNAAGKTGGEKKHILTWRELAEHDHVEIIHIAGQGSCNIRSGGYNTSGDWRRPPTDAAQNVRGTYGWAASGGTSTESDPLTTCYTGKSEPHENMPPYITVYMWERTA